MVGQTVKLLKEHHLLEETDVVIFDVLGDVVCGGFARAVAARRPRGDRDGNDFDSIYAMNRIIAAVEAKARNYGVRLAGCVANRSKDTDEVDVTAIASASSGSRIFPISTRCGRSRLKKKTLFEMPEDEDVLAVQREYLRLAQLLWAGTEPLAPAPLPDRRHFRTARVRLMRRATPPRARVLKPTSTARPTRLGRG